MSDQWWMHRCTHGMADEPPEVIEEAEGVVILHFGVRHVVHILVDRTGLGSVCKQLPCAQFEQLEKPDITKLVQAQMRELRQSLG